MPLDPKARINMEGVAVLVVDDNLQNVEILRQLFNAFGVRTLVRASSMEEARQRIQGRELNLIVCNDVLADGTGYEFVRWLRRSKIQPNNFTPVMITSGHTRRSMVHEARDCGANFVLAKPLSSNVLLERVAWVARESRPYLEVGDYVGPDRRFQDLGPPATGGRRRHDVVAEEQPDVAAALLALEQDTGVKVAEECSGEAS